MGGCDVEASATASLLAGAALERLRTLAIFRLTCLAFEYLDFAGMFVVNQTSAEAVMLSKSHKGSNI
jgi:hypothetical protein